MPITAILEPTAALIEQIAPRLKPSDVKAIQIFGINDPASALRLAFNRGEVLFVGTIDGEAVCVVSIIPKAPNAYTPAGGREGSIWMVTTPEFSGAPVAVLRKSRALLDKIAASYTALDTVIDRGNQTNIGYARFLGFEDWGAHYDTVIGGVTLGYFCKETPAPSEDL